MGEDVSGINAIAGFMDRKAAIVALPVDDWNAELTPWPAPPLRRGKPFAGNADKMLERLDRLMSELPTLLKSNMGITVSKCLLIGYSLGGLCALWAATMRDCFDGVASVSGSLWYDGFDEYIGGHAVNAHAVYLSLATRNRVLAIRGLAGWGTARLLYMIDLLKWTYGLSLNGIRKPLRGCAEAQCARCRLAMQKRVTYSNIAAWEEC